MALILFPETYELLQKRFGPEEAKEIIKVLDTSFQAYEKRAQEILESARQKADFLIAQKKFELKDELTKELATKADVQMLKADVQMLEGVFKADNIKLEGVVKADIVRLEGFVKTEVARLEGQLQTVRQEIQTVRQEIKTAREEVKTANIKLDRKFTIMFLILLFTIVFLNQNSLEFIARLLGLIKP